MTQEYVKGRLSELLEKRRYAKECDEAIDLMHQKVVNLLMSEAHNAQAVATNFVNDVFDGLPAVALQAENEDVLEDFLNTLVDEVSMGLEDLWPADEYSRTTGGWSTIARGFSFMQCNDVKTVLNGMRNLSGPVQNMQEKFEGYRKIALQSIEQNGQRLSTEIAQEKDIRTMVYIYSNTPNKNMWDKMYEFIKKGETSRFPALQVEPNHDRTNVDVHVSGIRKAMEDLEKRLKTPNSPTV